jgi:DNA-binding XRE family transcriptional regulator
MDKKRFAKIRVYLGKTQKQMAQLMGTSAKAIESFEQGWRNITPQRGDEKFNIAIGHTIFTYTFIPRIVGNANEENKGSRR